MRLELNNLYIQRQYFLFKNLLQFFKYHSTTRKRGIYVGCTDMDNLGDEAVFLSIKKLFEEDVFLFKISYKHRDASLSLIRKFWRAPDIIILGGGTLISRGPKEGYLKLLQQVTSIFKNAELFVFGTGVSEVQLALQAGIPTDVAAWSAELNKSQAIAVRGNISKGYLKDWKINAEVQLAGDPAIFFSRDVIIKKNHQRKIGVNFCNILGRIHGLDNEVLEQFGTQLFEILRKEKWDIYLFPMTSTDYEFMHDSMLGKNVNGIKHFPLTNSTSKALDFLESMDIFFGQRLHSIVFAHNVYTPFYAIEYHSKTHDYLKMMGLQHNSMRTDKLNVELAYERLVTMYDNIEKEQQILYDTMQHGKKQLIVQSVRFRKLINHN